jgi:hypothetical protein
MDGLLVLRSMLVDSFPIQNGPVSQVANKAIRGTYLAPGAPYMLKVQACSSPSKKDFFAGSGNDAGGGC